MKLNEAILAVLRYLHNGGIADTWLLSPTSGTFTVNSGEISLDGDFEAGDWIVIADGKKRHSGIYLLEAPEENATPQLFALKNGTGEESPFDGNITFTGTVYRLNVPFGFIDLCKEIRDYMLSDDGKPNSLISESIINSYKWTRATDADGKPLGWKDLFSDRLPPFVMWNSVQI